MMYRSLNRRLSRFKRIRRLRMFLRFIWHFMVLSFFVVLIMAGASLYVASKIINSDSITSLVTSNLQTFVNQPIMLDSISLNSWGKIEIKGFKISDTVSANVKNIVYADSLILSYDMASLMDKKIDIKEITLQRPVVHVLRRKDLSWNFDGLMINSKDASVKSAGSEFLSAFKIVPTINKISVDNGNFTFYDEGEDKNYIINDAALELDNLIFGENCKFTTAFSLPLTVNKGTYKTDINANGIINLIPGELEKARLINTDVTIRSPKIINGDIKLWTQAENFNLPKVEAKLTLPIIRDTLISSFTKTAADFSVPASKWSFNLTADVKNNVFRSDSVKIDFDGMPVAVKAEMLYQNGKFTYKTDAKLEKTEFKKITAWWKAPKAYKLTGAFGAQVQLSGVDNKAKVENLTVNGYDVNFDYKGFKIKNLGGEVGISKDFSRYAYKVSGADVFFGSQTVRNIRASGLYTEQDDRFALYTFNAALNDSPVRMAVDIANVTDEKKRNIYTTIDAGRFDNAEVYNLVIDIRDALLIKGSNAKYEESDKLAWLHYFKDGIPELMPRIRGGLYAKRFISPVIEGDNFTAEVDLRGLLPSMRTLNGKIEARLENAVVHKLAEMAEKEKALGVVYMPFLMMHRMERAGAFKVGQVLRDVKMNELGLSCSFKNGNMAINNFYADGPDLGAALDGSVNWVLETMDINVFTLFKKRSGGGAVSETLTDESGLPALTFAINDKMNDPRIQMKSPKKTGAAIAAAKAKGPGTNFKLINTFTKQGEQNASEK